MGFKRKTTTNTNNPLSDLIDNETFQTLNNLSLLNKKAVQVYQVQKRFDQLIEEGFQVKESIALLQKEFTFLDFGLISKLTAQVNKVEK